MQDDDSSIPDEDKSRESSIQEENDLDEEDEDGKSFQVVQYMNKTSVVYCIFLILNCNFIKILYN